MSINIGTLDIGVAFAGDTAGLQKATADAQQGIDRFGASTSKAMRQVREDTQGAENALSRLSQGFKGAVIGSSVAVGLIKLKNTALEAAGALIQAQVQLDKLNNGFKFGAGGSAGGARELSFVREEANRLGLELGGAATQYMKMVAAARGSNMEGEKTRVLFTSIAEAATVMGMSGEQSERAMMAVVQMMSKGKVQAEELRGQLGEHLPGAFAIAARAMGVTEVELNKLMETGQVMSADFLPKFAAQLRNELGGSVEDATKSMQASLNRYETAWLNFKQNVAQSGVSDAMGGQINILSDAFNGISERMEAARKAGGGFWSQTAAGAGGVAAFLNPINALSYSAVSLQGQLDQAKTKLNELEKERPYSGNIFLGPAIEETKLLIAELERAKAARDQLARQPGTGASESRYSAMADAEATKAQQAKGYAYAKLMGDMATPQEKLTEAIFKAKQELGELYSPEIEARLREHFIKPTREAKKEVDDLTKAAVRGQKLFGDLSATEGGLAGDFAEKWGDLSAAYAKTYINAEQLLAAQAALLKLQPFYKKGLDEEKEAAKEQAKATAEAAKAYDAYYDAVQKNTDTLQGNIQSENDAAAAIGLSAIAIAELEAAKLQDMAASKERAALTWESIDLSGEMTANLRAEAKALRDLAAAKVNRANKDTAYDEAKKAAEAWKKASEQIEKDITDALMRGFESGKGFAEVLRDTVVNMFKTLVLRPMVSAIVSPIATAATGAVSSAASGFASSAVGSAVGGSVLGGATVGSVGQYAATGFMNTVAGTGTAAGMSAGAAVGGANGAAMTAGAIAPWVLGALAIGSLIKSLDDSGTYHSGGLGSFSAAGGAATGNAVKGQGLGFDLASKDYTASGEQAAAQIAQAVVGLLDSTAQTFGGKAGAYAATAFADDSSKSGAWGALMVRIGDQMVIDWKNGTDKWPGREFADGEAGATEYAAAVATDVRDYLLTQTPGWADAMLSALGDAPTLESLSAVVAQINAAAAALEGMGRASASFAGLSEAATSALITAMGGAEAAVANLSGYYTNFYSESERASIATQQLTEQFAALGVALPASRDAFRELVDTAVAAGDTTLAAGLLKLQGSFASLVPAAADATAAMKSVVSGLKSETKSLQRELLVASGGDVRAFDIKGMDASSVAIYDYNQSLRDQITTVKNATQANEDARARAKVVEQERNGLNRQLLEAMGDTAAIRALELAALDPSNRAIQEHIWAIEDAAAAYEKATNAAQAAYSTLERSVDAERTKLAATYNDEKDVITERLKIQQQGYQAQIAAAQTAADKIRDIASALSTAVGQVRVDSPTINRAAYDAARGVIGTNNINDPRLQAALQSVSGDNKQFYGKFEDYAFEQAVTAANIRSMDAAAQSQLSAAEAMIQSLKASDTLAQVIADAELAALEEKHAEDLEKLQAQLDLGKSQLDALLGIDTSVLSVADAITALGGAISTAYAAKSAQIAAATAATAARSTGASGGGGGGASGGAAYVAKEWTDAELTALGFSPADIRATAARAAGAGASSGLDQYVNSIIKDGRDNLLNASGFNWTTMADKTGRIFKDAGEVLSQWTSAQAVAASEAWTNGGINGITSDELAHINSIKDKQAPGQLYSGSGSIDFGNVSTNTGQSYSAQDVAAAVKEVMAYGAQPDAIAQLAATQYGIDRESLQNIAAMYGIPGFATGINRVPRDMLAQLHEGEAVVPTQFNPFNPGATTFGSSEVVAELRQLNERMSRIEATNAATAGHTAATDRKLARVIRNDAMVTEAATA